MAIWSCSGCADKKLSWRGWLDIVRTWYFDNFPAVEPIKLFPVPARILQ